MTDTRDIILRSVVTEKSMDSMNDKKYIFDVFVSATRTQVRNAIEEISDVRVKNTNIMDVRDKEKRVGRYTGKTACRRKVIVTLTEGSNGIKTFNDSKEN